MSFTSVSGADGEDGHVKCFGEAQSVGAGFGEEEGVGAVLLWSVPLACAVLEEEQCWLC